MSITMRDSRLKNAKTPPRIVWAHVKTTQQVFLSETEPFDLEEILQDVEPFSTGSERSSVSEWSSQEEWLNNNPDFVASYFTRKATASMIESWLIAHSQMDSDYDEERIDYRASFATRRQKLTLKKYDCCDHLDPLYVICDGRPTFITELPLESPHPEAIDSLINYYLKPNATLIEEIEMIFELMREITSSVNMKVLYYKIVQSMVSILNASRGAIYLARDCPGADGPTKCLISNMYNISLSTTFEYAKRQEKIVVIGGTGIIGHTAATGETVNIPDAYADSRFNKEIDARVDSRTESLLTMPIRDSANRIIAVAQVANKISTKEFTKEDEKILEKFLKCCSVSLRNLNLYEIAKKNLERSKVLNELTFILFEEQSTVDRMMYRMMPNLKIVLSCQRIQVLLFQDYRTRIFSRIYCCSGCDSKPSFRCFPINYGITGYVAATGKSLNITNVYDSVLFDPSVDSKGPAFRHKSVLCVAIRNYVRDVIGVMELVNKIDNKEEIFTANDQSFVEAFALLCGLGIYNTKQLMQKSYEVAKYETVNKELSYHKTARSEDVRRLMNLKVPIPELVNIYEFSFDEADFDDDGTIMVCLRLFKEFDFMDQFSIESQTLYQWLLSVKISHREGKYHNWRHCVSVAQMLYVILARTKWYQLFGSLECIGLLIACLCHDLENVAYDCDFTEKTQISPLAQLSSTTLREHHEYTQCLMILRMPGHQILGNLSIDEYRTVMMVVKESILATNLEIHLKNRSAFLKNIERNEPSKYLSTKSNYKELRQMLMTVCDLNRVAKPWRIEKRVYEQLSGDYNCILQKLQSDSNMKQLSFEQAEVEFIDEYGLPLYKAFAVLSHKFNSLCENIEINREHWLALDEETVATAEYDMTKT